MTSTGPDMTGSAAGGAQPGQGKTGDDGGGFTGAAASMFESYAQFMAQLAGGATGTDAQPGRGPSTEGMSAALVQAWSISSGSAFRYGQSLTEVLARHQGALADAASARLSGKDPTEAQKRAEAEQLRHFLREMGETAMREARRFEHELEQLGEAVAQGVGSTMSEEEYRRYWAAKR